MTAYRLLFDRVLTRVDAERAHRLGFAALHVLRPVTARRLRPGSRATGS